MSEHHVIWRTYQQWLLIGLGAGLAALLWAAQALAQSAATLAEDLYIAQLNVRTCMSNFAYERAHPEQYGPRPNWNRDQVREHCIAQAVARYRERVQIEERLIEEMSRICCPYVKAGPRLAPPTVPPPGRDEQERALLAALLEGLRRASGENSSSPLSPAGTPR